VSAPVGAAEHDATAGEPALYPRPEDLGRPIRGPRALTDDWGRFWHLVFNIARNEFKLRFFGSALGYVWQLVRPLMLFGVLYLFFTKVGRFGANDRFYPAQLLGSIVLFTFFAEATGGAVRSVVDRENIVRKIQFPRMVIPLSVVLTASFNLALNLVVVMVFALAEGVRPMLSWLELPLIVLMLGALATGLAMLLSALYVSFRDLAPIWEVVTQALFYVTPIIYPITQVANRTSAAVLHIYMLNPLAVVSQQFRHAMIWHGTKSAGQALGGWLQLLEPLAIVAAILVAGFVVFNRSARLIAENL
jgi:ABC-2 type transport system permease protein